MSLWLIPHFIQYIDSPKDAPLQKHKETLLKNACLLSPSKYHTNILIYIKFLFTLKSYRLTFLKSYRLTFLIVWAIVFPFLYLSNTSLSEIFLKISEFGKMSIFQTPNVFLARVVNQWGGGLPGECERPRSYCWHHKWCHHNTASSRWLSGIWAKT